MTKISPTVPGDLPGLVPIIEATGLFPAEMLPAMFAAEPSFGAPPALWLTAEGPKGFAYAHQEPFTEAAWNLLAIGVDPVAQRQGVGRALLLEVEARARQAGGQVLLIDTADLPEFAPARALYRGHGYVEEARIRDFWAPSVAKLTFW